MSLRWRRRHNGSDVKRKVSWPTSNVAWVMTFSLQILPVAIQIFLPSTYANKTIHMYVYRSSMNDDWQRWIQKIAPLKSDVEGGRIHRDGCLVMRWKNTQDATKERKTSLYRTTTALDGLVHFLCRTGSGSYFSFFPSHLCIYIHSFLPLVSGVSTELVVYINMISSFSFTIFLPGYDSQWDVLFHDINRWHVHDR